MATDSLPAEKMLACPFCGSDDIDAAFWKSGDGKTGPGCMTCGGNAESIEAWNKRAPNEPSDARKKFDEPLYSEGDVMTFIGFMSGWITELNGVEMGRLQSSWDEFCKRAGLPQRPTLETCGYCHGNDRDAPCAYPSEGKPGCLRDRRLSNTLACPKCGIQVDTSDPYNQHICRSKSEKE